MTRAERITVFTGEIWRWYAEHKRDLPWRDLAVADDSERAYRILVSEVMLQQTQVSRVKILYRVFLEQFPSLADLSRASNGAVIRAWRGMGYNNRALRLRDAARAIVDRHGGVFPKTMEDLESLPGLGHYTAAAIRNFAFNIPTPCLDTNIRRILHRAFVGPENSDGTWEKDDAYLLKLAGEVLSVALETCDDSFIRSSFIRTTKNELTKNGSPRTSATWHAALMDFGSLVCTKRNPKWDACPLTKAGVMKAAYRLKVPKRPALPAGGQETRKEPGRKVGSKFIPNRIFRGRIIEELRDAAQGLPASEIGRRVCIDWESREHGAWLRGVIATLKRDGLVYVRSGKVMLSD